MSTPTNNWRYRRTEHHFIQKSQPTSQHGTHFYIYVFSTIYRIREERDNRGNGIWLSLEQYDELCWDENTNKYFVTVKMCILMINIRGLSRAKSVEISKIIFSDFVKHVARKYVRPYALSRLHKNCRLLIGQWPMLAKLMHSACSYITSLGYLRCSTC